MRTARAALSAGFALALCSSPVLAGNLEGMIESVDRSNQSIVVQGITFFVTDSSEYDDVGGFGGLRQGQTVEIEFAYRDGRHFAEEIELE